MIYEELNFQNLKTAIAIQHEIFPLENGSEDIKSSLDNRPEYYSTLNYWLPQIDGEYIGICGIYAYTEYPESAWLGWFGIREQYRKKGYATQILNFILEQAKNLGFKTLRLYTDEEDNSNAINLYKKFGMTSEIYDNPDDKHFEISKTIIFSKSLTSAPVQLWNNKNLYLNIHDEKNNL